MSSSATDSRALASSLSKLNIASSNSKKPKVVAPDSWEDEDLSGEDTETEEPSKHQRNLSTVSNVSSFGGDGPSAPPPTPASPSGRYPDDAFENPYQSLPPSRERQQNKTPERRPEKTTSVAARMIAGSLGVRVPKRTEEQREFDKAVKEKEKKRRAEEKEKAEQEEKLKASVWED